MRIPQIATVRIIHVGTKNKGNAMGIFDKLFGKKEVIDEDSPFMEHPYGQFDTALQAISSAMKRLDKMDMQDKWIDFCAQGQGANPDLTQIADISFNGQTFNIGEQTINLQPILDSAGVQAEITQDGKITLVNTTPEQRAIFLDLLFQKHYGIKPFDDEGDYAVGAEW